MSRPDDSGADSLARDFATAPDLNPPLSPASAPAAPSGSTSPAPQETTPIVPKADPHVQYATLSIDTGVGGGTNLAPPTDPARSAATRSDTELARSASPFSPGIRRRLTRTGTFKTVEDFDDFEARPGWHPGAEPGVDPSKPDGGHASMPTLSASCEITVVDFSQDQLNLQTFDNETLGPFLKLKQPQWVKCRWINVNGLSWDVIKLLGRHKNLHKLAIEDIMNIRNRTKAEWFPTHAFIVLTLQKLVHLFDSDDEDSDDDAKSWTSGRSHKTFWKRMKRMFGGRRLGRQAAETGLETGNTDTASGGVHGDIMSQPTGFSDALDPTQIRTLQRYHASPNDSRARFMERHSALHRKDLAVACEQVSMFITRDNTIISFFEYSATDIENPIIRRLQTPDTIIRQSCDAFMVGQAIIDAIIDLAIPVTACYGDVIGDLEMDILTRPNLDHTKKLYVVISEINKVLSFINPIVTLITALRDHKTDMSQDVAVTKLQDPAQGVIITPMTYTYLGDVLDHCLVITESLNQLKDASNGMIDLIFNTISAYQNESMKQLTVATIIFLPLTFLTGYFGQNFEGFDELSRGTSYFWQIAAPVSFVTIVILLREVIYDYIKSLAQRRYVWRLRKDRSKRREKRKRP
ncbi:putative transporter [Diplogelasinospora grovesii]|uniref:Transporter n=1 Tax=Diplogelasinospora grovesii TaxID=303347 RepID=A0AAN6NGD4_9PEZI|nr:putative transporter [Diplogelasinospora grovesii]